MLKLLLAVDGSENAHRAAAFVRGLIDRGIDIQPVLLHVRKPVLSGEVGPLAGGDVAEKVHADKAHDAIERAREVFAGTARPPLVVEAEGHAAEEIARAADEHGCDGIVIGRRGLGALGSVLLGSVSSRVSRMASVPVTVVT